jgi:hypothetical protein
VRILVCGSRTWTNVDAVYNRLYREVAIPPEYVQLPLPEKMPLVVIDGKAQGADTCGYIAALRLKPLLAPGNLITERYPADWNRYGRSAGFKRNQQMLTEGHPDLVLAFWDGHSRGTRHMIELAWKAGVKVEIVKP